MNVGVMHLPTAAGSNFGVVAAVLMLAALIEKPKPDERDRYITLYSSHVAFLSVAVLLTGVLVYQTLSGDVQIWTLAAMVVMIIAKIVGRLTGERRS